MSTPEELFRRYTDVLETGFRDRLQSLEATANSLEARIQLEESSRAQAIASEVKSIKEELEGRLRIWERWIIGIAILFLGGTGAALYTAATQEATRRAIDEARTMVSREINKRTEEFDKYQTAARDSAAQTASKAETAIEVTKTRSLQAQQEIDRLLARTDAVNIDQIRKLNSLLGGLQNNFDNLARKLADDPSWQRSIAGRLDPLPAGAVVLFSGAGCPQTGGWKLVETLKAAGRVACLREPG
ncbi:hypothetical protein QTI66_32750 [Variovorax sp. J22R133]|uniref:hypothetical protein n=1 Tax=Variovorax brevis TaxID=3053503 RepID=UPI002577D327|nr:hypothetical protein [Variovorax sp. J22R133]MDM0116898.1 hypothetical protein [Variovorax sp. J22R133]